MKTYNRDWTGTVCRGVKVLGRAEGRLTQTRRTEWWCECLSCHRFFRINTQHFMSQESVACGCRVGDHRLVFSPGQRFGRLLTLDATPKADAARSLRWRCRCDCGKICSVAGTKLNRGIVKSCGCAAVNPLTPYTATCRRCGAVFQAKSANRRYCNNRCRFDRVPTEKPCKRCQKLFIGTKSSQLFCNRNCTQQFNKIRRRKEQLEREALQQFRQLNQLLQEKTHGR